MNKSLTKKDFTLTMVLSVVFLVLIKHFERGSELLNNDQALILEGAFFVSFTLSFYIIERLRRHKRKRLAYEQICPAHRIIKLNLVNFANRNNKRDIRDGDGNNIEIVNIIQNAHRLDQAVQTSADSLDEELLKRVNYLAVSLTSIEKQTAKTSFSVEGLLRCTNYIKLRLDELKVDYNFYIKKHDDFILNLNKL